MAEMETERNAAAGAPMVGDHLALDLLNTQARGESGEVEYWNTGDDVLAWLARHGVAPLPGSGQLDRDALLVQAKELRALARRAIGQRKAGQALDGIDALNAVLHACPSVPHLGVDADGKLIIQRQVQAGPVALLLGPLAEAVASLLADGDFALVRQCEHPDCILWFYDRTKAHKRRWCSMALCGNRYKAARFRQRSAAA